MAFERKKWQALEEKDPCWKLMDCPEYVHNKCPAYFNPERPCWEMAYTQSEILIGIHKDCKYCKVYRLYDKFPVLERNLT